MTHPITPCLWFDSQAEEAANFYVSIFKNSKIEKISRYGKEGFEIHGQKENTVLTVEFSLNNSPFTALNGGPVFQFNEAVSFQILCDSQEEIDHYWNSLTADGGKEGQCGWLKDKYGVSWQVFPKFLQEWMCESAKADKLMKAFMPMKKINIEALLQSIEK